MGDRIICDGALSADDFYIAAKELCEQWKSANTTLPNWTWLPCKRMTTVFSCNEGYLSLENVYHIKSKVSSEDLFEEQPVDAATVEGYLSLENVYHIKSKVSSEDLFEEEEQPVDAATVVQVPNGVIHAYDFHIVYSFSYRAPVLYFHGHQSDGQPLNLDEILKDLPEYSVKLSRESKWTFITLEEHPYLHRPWYMLHPCATNEWMKLLLLQGSPYNVNYLVSWLSVVGQAVGLRIPASLTGSCYKDGSSSSIG